MTAASSKRSTADVKFSLRLSYAAVDHTACELEHVLRRNTGSLEQRKVRAALDSLNPVALRRGGGEITPGCLRYSPRVAPDRFYIGHGIARIRQSQDRVRRAELRMGEVWRRFHRLHHRDVACLVVGDQSPQFSAAAITVAPSPAICADAITKWTLCG